MRVLVNKLPQTSAQCRFFNEKKGKCSFRKLNGWDRSLCYCNLKSGTDCPFLVSFEEELEWMSKLGKIPSDFEKTIHNIQEGKLPPLNSDFTYQIKVTTNDEAMALRYNSEFNDDSYSRDSSKLEKDPNTLYIQKKKLFRR